MTESPLTPEDIKYLDETFGDRWNLVPEGDKYGIVICKYRLPEGYTPAETDLMVIVPENYPAAMIDMFYFNPAVARNDGVAIAALSSENHFDRQWQRWSRHYDWDPGLDSLVRHLEYVPNQLKSEVGQ